MLPFFKTFTDLDIFYDTNWNHKFSNQKVDFVELVKIILDVYVPH